MPFVNREQHAKVPCECSGQYGQSCVQGVIRCNKRLAFIQRVREAHGLKSFWDVKPRHVEAYLERNADVDPDRT